MEKNAAGEKKTLWQEVEGIDTSLLSMSHLVIHNPVLYASPEVKEEYYAHLKTMVQNGMADRSQWGKEAAAIYGYARSELSAYQKILRETKKVRINYELFYCRYFLLLDLVHITGYEIKRVFWKSDWLKEYYFSCFPENRNERAAVDELFDIFQTSSTGQYQRMEGLAVGYFSKESEYIRLMARNQMFRDKPPFRILVTSTMSAGKSTFINALVGKYISRSQNMACTSKVHCILNKAYEDGYAYEYDHDLVMTAGSEELLNDNEKNESDYIVVGTRFDGTLAEQRIEIYDTPGVNFSGDASHKAMTNRLIKEFDYHIVVYIMNATQLGTEDESVHLDYIRKTVGQIPILFVINKADVFDMEDEDISSVFCGLREYLRNKGFTQPMVCPVSARAGYLAKKRMKETLSRRGKTEFDMFADTFEEMDLSDYYTSEFPGIRVSDSENDAVQLQKTCGLAYIEKIILAIVEREGNNGAGIYEV